MANQYTSKKAKAAKAKEKLADAGIRIRHVEPQDLPPEVKEALTAFLGPIPQPSKNPCTEKALKQNLPHFTLLPSDNFTPIVLRLWIDLALQHGVSEEKVLDARALLKRIEAWRTANPLRCKIPN